MFVVMIHTPFFEGWHKVITGVAVPCFFIISGFLLYNDDAEKFSTRLVRNLKKIIRITILSTFFYVFAWELFMIDNPPIVGITFKSIIVWIFSNECPVCGVLWYLYAYIYTLIIIFIINKNGWFGCLKYLAPALYILSIIIGKIASANLDYNVKFGAGFLSTGIPYFTLGLFLKKYFFEFKEKIEHPIFIFLLLFGLSICNEICFRQYNFYDIRWCITPFLAISLFLIFTLSSSWQENWISRIGKDLSLYIYIFHFIIASVFSKFCALLALNYCLKICYLIGALIIFVLSILFSIIFVIVKNRIFRYFENE